MLNDSLCTIKNNTAKENKSGLWKDWRQRAKVDDIIFRGGAFTRQDFRKRILNLHGSELHSHVSAINFARWSS